MFQTLNGADPLDGGSPDSSSLSEHDDESLDASDPGFDGPDYEAEVANGMEDGEEDADFEEDDTEEEDIPFHNHPRWKELMGRKKALEDELANMQGFAPVVERLREMGIGSAEEFDAAYAAEEQRQFEANLAQALNAGIRNGTIPPAAAQAHFAAALKQRQADQAMAQWRGYEIEQQLQAAKQHFPEMDEEMVRQVAQANHGRPGFDLGALARHSHERNLAYLERHLALYEAERADQPPAPISNERGVHAATGGRAAARRSWEDLLGLTRLVKT